MDAKVTKGKTSGKGAENVPSQGATDRLDCIAIMAYYKAEARGFLPGKEMEDWLAAEAEFDKQKQSV